MPNLITEAFRQHLNTEKLLVMVSPGRQPEIPRPVSLVYDDGTEETFTVNLGPVEFMESWKNFNRWFGRFREANTGNPWPEE